MMIQCMVFVWSCLFLGYLAAFKKDMGDTPDSVTSDVTVPPAAGDSDVITFSLKDISIKPDSVTSDDSRYNVTKRPATGDKVTFSLKEFFLGVLSVSLVLVILIVVVSRCRHCHCRKEPVYTKPDPPHRISVIRGSDSGAYHSPEIVMAGTEPGPPTHNQHYSTFPLTFQQPSATGSTTLSPPLSPSLPPPRAISTPSSAPHTHSAHRLRTMSLPGAATQSVHFSRSPAFSPPLWTRRSPRCGRPLHSPPSSPPPPPPSGGTMSASLSALLSHKSWLEKVQQSSSRLGEASSSATTTTTTTAALVGLAGAGGAYATTDIVGCRTTGHVVMDEVMCDGSAGVQQDQEAPPPLPLPLPRPLLVATTVAEAARGDYQRQWSDHNDDDEVFSRSSC